MKNAVSPGPSAFVSVCAQNLAEIQADTTIVVRGPRLKGVENKYSIS